MFQSHDIEFVRINLLRARVALFSWDEMKHPRDDQGQWVDVAAQVGIAGRILERDLRIEDVDRVVLPINLVTPDQPPIVSRRDREHLATMIDALRSGRGDFFRGASRPIVVDALNRVVDGHNRLEAQRQMGKQTVAVLRIRSWNVPATKH